MAGSALKVAAPGSPSSVRGRLFRGFGATALGPVVTMLIQVVSVPVFLHFWGAKLYGEWLILSAIPSYISLSDLGFGNVAANDMTMHVAAGERNKALETFQSTWVLISLSSLIFAAVVSLTVQFTPVSHWLNLSLISLAQTRVILVVLCAYALLSLQSGLILSGFRCEHNYAFGMVANNLLRIAEMLVTMLMVAMTRQVVVLAIGLLGVRIVGTIVLNVLLHLKSPWISYGVSHFQWSTLRVLFMPAIAFMGFPVGSALSLQGMVLLVGITLGPSAVALFSTMRTLARSAMQVIEVVKNSIWPEMSVAYGTQNWELARKLHRFACQSALWLSVCAIGSLYLLGEPLFRLWTHGRIVLDARAFDWLLLDILANSFWFASSVVSIANNTHQKIAAAYVAGCAGAFVLAYFMMPHFGLSAAGMALTIGDICVGCYVIACSLSSLHEDAQEFLLAMFQFPVGAAKRCYSTFLRASSL